MNPKNSTILTSTSSGDLLYHYTSNEVLIEHILNDYTLKFNSLKNSHDPIEFIEKHHVGTIKYPIPTEVDNYNFHRFYEIQETLLNELKICCFSQDLEGSGHPTKFLHKGYMRPRMWVQYANKHTGVCLIFDKSKLLETVNNEYSQSYSGTSFALCNSVIYDDKLEELRKAYGYENNLETFEKSFVETIEERSVGYLFNKLNDFRDEQEFRIAIYDDEIAKKNEAYLSIKKSLIGIVVGCNYHDNYKSILKTHQKNNNIDLFKIKWNTPSPKVISF
ncbi:MAG: DUF2971 domain-containing protein [Reichenbachiella sp.]